MLLLPGCDSGSDTSIFKQDAVRIGTKNNQPGTSTETATHGWSGFDVSVGEQLVKTLGKSGSGAHFSDVVSKQRESVLTTGAEDLVIATYSITTDRTNKVYFAGPYAMTYQGFLVRAGDPAWLHSLDDLARKTVCTWSGTTSEEELDLQAPVKGYLVQHLTDAQACLTELRAGRAAALSTDQLILYGLQKENPEMVVVPEVTIGVPNAYGIGIKKERLDDCIRIRDFLKDYISSPAWTEAFDASLKVAGNPDLYRPQRSDIDAMSCKHLPG
ncbi:transporter substrate-binding domain-containing protein [Kitasatospora sp. NPDC101183]|uniref:transporter substrate-binding domain-containing protein n=1 Tax=Kitasatospora sp. NPDC101183 TaxID=3364100 RepID=UPI0037FB9CF1